MCTLSDAAALTKMGAKKLAKPNDYLRVELNICKSVHGNANSQTRGLATRSHLCSYGLTDRLGPVGRPLCLPRDRSLAGVCSPSADVQPRKISGTPFWMWESLFKD